MNKNFILSFVGLISVVFLLPSCFMTEKKQAEKKQVGKFERILASQKTNPFWKAKKGSSVFYLLGTIHLGVSLEDIQCSKVVQDKIKKSPLLFVENFTSGTEYMYNNNYENNMRTLYLGSKERREQMLAQLSEEARENIINRKNFRKLGFVRDKLIGHIRIGMPLTEDEGQFKDLNKDSQNFLIQYHLYDENKNYLDYYLDIFFMNYYDAFFSSGKYLDAEITKLALDYNILIKSLDTNESLVADLQKEVEKLYDKMKVEYNKVTKADIDYLIANYEKQKQELLDSFSSLYSSYHSMDWNKDQQGGMFNWFLKKLSGSFAKNRNSAWVEKILLNSKSQDQAVFVAAGYLHFTGYYNVLEMLKNKGFEVTLIDPETCQF